MKDIFFRPNWKIRFSLALAAVLLAGLLAGSTAPANAAASENRIDPLKQFTITGIAPDAEARTVAIRLSEICDKKSLRKNLRIAPPLWINWGRSRIMDNVIYLRANFSPGQNYALFIPENYVCRGREYTPTLTRFRMPDLKPSVRFESKGSVIELSSRQMIHAEMVNLTELTLSTFSLPPLLLPRALELTGKKQPLEAVQTQIQEDFNRLSPLMDTASEFSPFWGAPEADHHLFFPGIEKNSRQVASFPLSFRTNREKGGVFLTAINGRNQGNDTQTPARLVSITDLSVTYKLSSKGILVWITRLSTGRAVSGAVVGALDTKHQAYILGKTDENGILRVKNNKILPCLSVKEPFGVSQTAFDPANMTLLMVAGEKDASFMTVKPGGQLRPDWVRMADPKKTELRRLSGKVFTERGVYRPGDTVFFKGTVREFANQAVISPRGLAPVFRIQDARGEKVYEKTLTCTGFGTAADSFEIKPYFPLGPYTLTMTYGQDEKDRADFVFQVQEFRPPRHYTRISFAQRKQKTDAYVNRDIQLDLLDIGIAGLYHVGGPVKHGKIRWKIYHSGTRFPQTEFSDFSFGNFKEKRTDLLESGESILDENGEIKVTIPLSASVLSGLNGVEVAATVVDFDGRSATETAVFQIKPQYLVGLGPHEKTVNTGEKLVLEALVLSPDKAVVPDGRLSVSVLQKGYTYVRKRNQDGNLYWDWDEIWNRQLTSPVQIQNSRALYEFEFTWGGEHLLEFTYTDTDGKKYTSSTLYQVRGDYYGFAYENKDRNFEKLSLSANRKQYKPGDPIRLFMTPHRPLVKALVTVETDEILEQRVITPRPGERFIELAASPEFVPNAYISVLATTARGDFPVYTGKYDDQAPTFLYGVVNVNVKKAAAPLTVEIAPKKTELRALPGQTVEISLLVRETTGAGAESEIAVGVVDEAVLALTRYQTPDLEDLSLFLSPLAVFTGDSRIFLIRQTPFGPAGMDLLTGGGGLAKSPDAVTSKTRRDFRPVAYFNPSVHTDADGRAVVRFVLPDSMTTYRVYAVACDKGGGFGSAQRGLLAVKPFYLEPGLPRFFTRGDEFSFTVSAFNRTEETGTVDVRAGSRDGLSLSVLPHEKTVMPYDISRVPLTGKALAPGMSILTFIGSFSDASGKVTARDQLEIKTPVNSGHVLAKEAVFGTFNTAGEIRYDFPGGDMDASLKGLAADEVSVLLTVSGSPFLRMSKGLEYLLHYPYGCVEQTSSGVLPLAALRGLIQKGLIPGMEIDATDKFLKSGVQRLFSMQTDSGGFSYWPGHFSPHAWGTVYATSALTMTQLSGYPVDQKRLVSALKYLRAMLLSKKGVSSMYKAFCAFILAENDALDAQAFKPVQTELSKMSGQAALLTLMAGSKSGLMDEGEIQKQAETILSGGPVSGRSEAFYAPYRGGAIAVLAGSRLLPREPSTSRRAEQLLEGMGKNGIWTSTSDTGWALTALGAYFGKMSFPDTPVALTLKQPGAADRKMTMDPVKSVKWVPDVLKFIENPVIQVTSDKAMDLLFRLDVTYPRIDVSDKGVPGPFLPHKRIEPTDGSGMIKVGDVVKVRVTLTIPRSNRRYFYLVLDDPLPAGLVAINSAFQTEEPVGGQRESRWSYWDPETGFYRLVPNYFEIRDDRVVAFKDRSWSGTYEYVYYARAVCAGDFVMPPTTVQLMYEPEIVSYTPASILKIHGQSQKATP